MCAPASGLDLLELPLRWADVVAEVGAPTLLSMGSEMQHMSSRRKQTKGATSGQRKPYEKVASEVHSP